MQKKVLITGATSGIGKALASVFCKAGWQVWISGRNPEKLRATQKELSDLSKVEIFELDLTQIDTIIPKLIEFDRVSGGMDLVIANAGVGKVQTLDHFQWQTLKETHHVNALGAMATLCAFFKPMAERGHGHWVAISSLNADIASPGSSAYGSSKAAISHFMAAASAECDAAGIVTTLIHPGFIKTKMTDQNQFHMPFILPVDRAARMIFGAIKNKKRVYRFPWSLALIIRFSNLIPAHIRGRFVLKTLPKSSENSPSL